MALVFLQSGKVIFRKGAPGIADKKVAINEKCCCTNALPASCADVRGNLLLVVSGVSGCGCKPNGGGGSTRVVSFSGVNGSFECTIGVGTFAGAYRMNFYDGTESCDPPPVAAETDTLFAFVRCLDDGGYEVLIRSALRIAFSAIFYSSGPEANTSVCDSIDVGQGGQATLYALPP